MDVYNLLKLKNLNFFKMYDFAFSNCSNSFCVGI